MIEIAVAVIHLRLRRGRELGNVSILQKVEQTSNQQGLLNPAEDIQRQQHPGFRLLFPEL